MSKRWLLRFILLLMFCLNLKQVSASPQQSAQEPVRTDGGSPGTIAKFSADHTIADSTITESNGRVGIGIRSPAESLHINGRILISGSSLESITASGGDSVARFGQGPNGGFLSSDTLGKSLSFLTNSGNLISWLRISADGITSATNNATDNGEIVFARDDLDTVHSAIFQAGPQMHFRMSRAYCDKRSISTQSSADQANFLCLPGSITIDDDHPISSTPNRDFLISPYGYGTSLEYPGVIEAWSYDFSVHNNHRGCTAGGTYISSNSCESAAQFWVGDVTDSGGLFATANDVLGPSGVEPAQSFVLLAADTFSHTSHGELLFLVRDPDDGFRFQVGAYGQADDITNYKQYTKARIDGSGKGYFDGGTQTGGADFAESVAVRGARTAYTPGDVLAIDPDANERLMLAKGPYSKLVAGIYSTKPGVLATTHTMENPALTGEVPLGVVGIVPCKVSGENGAIRPGDLLVSSSTPGYAMKGTDQRKMVGAVIGKALQSFDNGSGLIQVLVTLR